MGGELAQIVGARARWRYSVGCVWAALVIRSRSREPGGEALRIVVLAGIAVALALGGYGVLRYPGLRHGYHLWSSLAVFVIVLALYAAVTLMLSRGTDRHATHARNYGLAGGLGVGLAWLAVLSPTPAFKSFVIVPLTVVLLGPACVAGLAGRTGNRAAGTLAGLWTAIVGGLLVFAVWVTVTYANAGRPYDAGLIRDFHHSGARDLATYAVSDNLGSGLVLLLLVPTVAFALGSLGARLGERHG